MAITKKGASRTVVSPSTETVPEFMASSRHDWVLGVVRLISSARITLAKMGPRLNSNFPAA